MLTRAGKRLDLDVECVGELEREQVGASDGVGLKPADSLGADAGEPRELDLGHAGAETA